GARGPRLQVQRAEPVAQLGGAVVLLAGDRLVELAHELLEHELAVDGARGAARPLAAVLGGAVVGPLDEGRQQLLEGAVALRAAERPGLAAAREAQAAGWAALGGRGALLGAGDRELGEELVDRLVGGEG